MPSRAAPVVSRTFLFADLRDYTVFVETQGDAAATRLLRAYRRIVRAEVAARHGGEVDTEGDSFYVIFETAHEAAACAVAIQQKAARHNEQHPDLALHIGIGINAGEAVPHGGKYVGASVIVAARLAGQATAGAILVTDTVRGLIRTSAVASLVDRGAWTLKGVAQPIRVFEVAATGPRTKAHALGPALRMPAVLQDRLPTEGLVICPELIQREAVMGALQVHLAAASAGDCRVIALSGEAGVGKSRICRELARVAQAQGLAVMGGRSHPGGPPFEALVAALRPFAQARGTEILRRLLGPLADELSRVLPEANLPVRAETQIPDDERRERFLRAMQLVLEDAAALRPVLLVLEDFHDADAGSRDLLRHLSAVLHASVCILFSYRTEEATAAHPLRAMLSDLDRERNVIHVELAPLDRAGARQMTSALLGERATDELATAVFDRSEGVPYYVEELLKTALDSRGPGALELPRTVRDSVQLRVERLIDLRGPQIMKLLEPMAVAGVPLDHDQLVALSGRSESAAFADIAAAVDAQLLERPPTRTELYQFHHALTREAIESAIPRPRRKRLHLRIAELLEATTRGRKRSALIARHYQAAGDRPRALRYAQAGAREAIGIGSYSAAIDLLRQAHESAAGTTEEPAVLEELAGALQAAGRAVEAEEAAAAARELFAAAGHTVAAARIDVRLAAILRMQGRRGVARDVVRRAIAALEDGGGDELVEALVTDAALAWAENDARTAVELGRRALVLARAAASGRHVVRAMTVLGAALARLGRDEGRQQLRDAVDYGRAHEHVGEVVDAYIELERAERAIGQWDAAREAAEAGLALARERGLEFAQSRLLAQLARDHISQGRYREARDVVEQAVALARPSTIAATSAMATLAEVLVMQGEHTSALELLDRIAPQLERHDPDARGGYLARRARALLGLGRFDEAYASVCAGTEVHRASTPGSGITTFLIAADVVEARGRIAEVEALAADYDRQFNALSTPTVDVLRAEIAAIRDAVSGRTAEAAAGFDTVADRYAVLGVPARADYRRAVAASIRMRTASTATRARKDVISLRERLAERGAEWYVSILDRALPARKRTVVSDRGPLTERDLRVALLIARGSTDARIASDLRISQAAVARLVASILGKLGVTSRAQVASWVVQRRPAEVAKAR